MTQGTFEEAKHPRDHGRFALVGGGGAPMAERRTLARMPSYYRAASLLPGMPPAYTGSDRKELPAGSFTKAEFRFHKLEGVPEEEQRTLNQGLVNVIQALREPTVARGHELVRRGLQRGQPMIPENTPKRTINRAYNHAAVIALHKYGVGHYDFAMDDDLKAEFEPLRQFMFYAQRRVTNHMHETHKGQWKPYRAAFGLPFKDRRKDVDGNERRRVKPLHAFIKAVAIGELLKFDESEHKRDLRGRFSDAVRDTAVGVGATVVLGAALPIQEGFKDLKALRQGKALPPKKPLPVKTLARNWRFGQAALAARRGSVRDMGYADTVAGTGLEAPPKHIWRGMHGAGASPWLDKVPGQRTFLDDASSWSTEPKVATHFTNYSYTKSGELGVIDHPQLGQVIKPNVPASEKRVRVVLRGVKGLRNAADIEALTTDPGPQKEIMVGRGTSIRIDRVRDSAAGRVIMATALRQSPKLAFRRKVWANLKNPGWHGTRQVLGMLAALPVVGTGFGVRNMVNEVTDWLHQDPKAKTD